MSEQVDWGRCEAWVEEIVAGNDAARVQLMASLWPVWLGWVERSRSMGSLTRSEDHVREVLTRVSAKLGDAATLRTYPQWRATNLDKSLEDWMRIVTANVVRDFVRSQLGASRSTESVSTKRLLNEFAGSLPAELGTRPPITAAQTARELLEYAKRRLPSEQVRALELWLQGYDFEEMATALYCDAETARKLVRAGVASLRREFNEPAAGP